MHASVFGTLKWFALETINLIDCILLFRFHIVHLSRMIISFPRCIADYVCGGLMHKFVSHSDAIPSSIYAMFT